MCVTARTYHIFTFLLPNGSHFNAFLGPSLGCMFKTCPIHFHLLFLTSLLTGGTMTKDFQSISSHLASHLRGLPWNIHRPFIPKATFICFFGFRNGHIRLLASRWLSPPAFIHPAFVRRVGHCCFFRKDGNTRCSFSNMI